MLRGGLKIRLTLLLAVLLLIGVTISNLVGVMFTQRLLVRSELTHIQWVVDKQLFPDSSFTRASYENIGEEFCTDAVDRCVYAGLASADELDHLESSGVQADAAQLLAEVERTNQRSFSLSGSAFRAFFSDTRYLLLADPVKSQTGEDEIFLLVWDLSQIYTAIKQDQRMILVYLLFNVAILTVLGFFRLVNLVIKPIDRLISVADQYQVTDSFFYSEGKDHSEFGQLNAALGNMIKRIESDHTALAENFESLEKANQELIKSQDEVVRAEKMASIGRLSAGFAHEIGNPITIIQGYIELLQKPNLSEAQKQDYSTKALEELQRVNTLISNLLDYARETKKESKPIQIDESLLENMRDIVGHEKAWTNVELLSTFEPSLFIFGSMESLRQVILNCILNAVDAIHARGEIRQSGVIEVHGRKYGAAGHAVVLIEIRDNGIGVSNELRSRVFDPFYTTKPPGEGTGLGLYVSHLIVESLGGRIWMESNEKEGATVWIELPEYED